MTPPGRSAPGRGACAPSGGALLLLAASLATAPAVGAVQAGPAELDAVEAAADRGDAEAAREALAAYVESADPSADAAERARVEFLRGRLAASPDSAEVAYLRAAIDGEGPYASRARLRLGQLQLARGDAARAEDHFARLRADDPGGALGAVSWMWSARAAELAGDVSAACAAWDRAIAGLPSSDPDRAEAEAGRSRCESTRREPGEVETFTVQLGAFGTEDAAMRLRDGAASVGVAVRVDRPAGGVHVYRVRSGRFASRSDAERRAERFRAAGHEAIVVPEDP